MAATSIRKEKEKSLGFGSGVSPQSQSMIPCHAAVPLTVIVAPSSSGSGLRHDLVSRPDIVRSR